MKEYIVCFFFVIYFSVNSYSGIEKDIPDKKELKQELMGKLISFLEAARVMVPTDAVKKYLGKKMTKSVINARFNLASREGASVSDIGRAKEIYAEIVKYLKSYKEKNLYNYETKNELNEFVIATNSVLESITNFGEGFTFPLLEINGDKIENNQEEELFFNCLSSHPVGCRPRSRKF